MAGVAGEVALAFDVGLQTQTERMQGSFVPSISEYFRFFGLDHEKLKVAKPDALIMHPGPMNRGVEITNVIADGPHSAVQQQVRNGVAVRMAVLATIVRNVQIRNVQAGRREI